MTKHIYMSAQQYAKLCAAAFPEYSKPRICAALSISRPSHDLWLKAGIARQGDAAKIQAFMENHIKTLRAQARNLDRLTTN